ncbi:hypothetical protein LRU_01081 [Ligilactobacillus ruminis SPM0211]|uniref:Uncharacterized protein n=1 Tax=Ligilactobacillus ruminis SPM0211 TaxID=1040964 RepID=F7R0J1_9LACO|nr:hypothetical protein LRU_01081 [Ligilactobacillus ruminis SPM0211]
MKMQCSWLRLCHEVSNCKSDPVFFVCMTIACYDGNNRK